VSVGFRLLLTSAFFVARTAFSSVLFCPRRSIEAPQSASGVVSPENSVDGVPPLPEPTSGMAPPIMSTTTAAPAFLAPGANLEEELRKFQAAMGTNFNFLPAQGGQVPLAPAPRSTGVPIAAAPPSTSFPTLPSQVPTLLAPAPPTVPSGVAFLQQANAATVPPHAKRRKVQQQQPQQQTAAAANPLLAALGGGFNPAALLSGPQLAAAAAQAMSQGRGRKKSQAQIDRRRERNRILARRTRLRKKFFFESLQKEVLDLQRENVILKEVVKTNLSEADSKKILDECDAAERLPESVLEALGECSGDMEAQDFNLVQSIQSSQHAFIITDPSLQDNPIVFASGDFLKMTGYTREQVLGRNCRFLQGTETSKDKVDTMRKAIASGEDVSVTFINYTADGTPFWNKVFVAALRDAQNNIVNFIGVTVKVACPEHGDPEHGKLLPGEKAKGGDDDDDDDYDEEDGAEDTAKELEGVVSHAVAAALHH
jgi:PAS domain S-box-containing protein